MTANQSIVLFRPAGYLKGNEAHRAIYLTRWSYNIF